ALATPANCIAEFSLIPIGSLLKHLNVFFAQQIADIQRLMQQSGLKYQVHATGTTIERPWDQVSQIIGFAHTLIHHQGIVWIQTDIQI
ncbi:thiamine-binding protein, partial [Aspergillus ruber CBS 135680]